MTTATHPQAPGRGSQRTGPPQFTRTSEQAIDGRYRPIPTHQLAIAWWLHQTRRITRRQLRIYFAAHEMAEQRRYTSPERQGHARYRLVELKRLVGGRGSTTADRDLSADVKRLCGLGLVSITETTITFAASIEQIRLEDDNLTTFWDFFQALPNRNRPVPVPRRTLRALAAGFSRGVTAYILAALIRSVFWRKQPGGGGQYHTDGRTKGSWIAETFGISRRAVTEARAHLIEIGWLEPRETPQWALNRWGVHDVVNVHWSPSTLQEPAEVEDPVAPVENSRSESHGHSGESASPPAENSGESATPINRSSLSTKDSETRRLGAQAPSPAGDSLHSAKKVGSRKKRGRPPRAPGKPSIRDIRPEDLNNPEALQELRTQAIELGFGFQGDSGELDFFALASRALTRGRRPGALFFNLISKHRTGFITIDHEDAARAKLRELRDGPDARLDTSDDGGGGPRGPVLAPLRPEARIVEACLRVAQQHRIADPFRVTRHHPDAKGWTRDQWDDAYLRYRHDQTCRQARHAGLLVAEGA